MPDQKITLKDIAKAMNVSVGTVHRAIYGKSGVSDETRRRILREVHRQNYQVDETASALKRKMKKIYVVLPKPQNEERFYFRGLWKEIRRAAAEMEPYKISFEFIQSECRLADMWMELERVYDESLDEMDGMITAADGEKASIWISRFAKRNVPVVLVSSHFMGDSGIVGSILGDHERCGLLAAEFMSYGLREKEKKVLLLSGDESVYSNEIYARSFETSLMQEGFQVKRIQGFGRKAVEKGLKDALMQEKVGGIFAVSARNTYAMCGILKELGLGNQIIAMGCDVFMELSPFFEDGTLNATICQYQLEQGRSAIRELYNYLSRGEKLEERILPPVMVMKQNYDCFLT